jgi:hypothetical protein
MRVKRIEREVFFALGDGDAIQLGGDGNCAAHGANATGAAAGCVEIFGEFYVKLHRAAVAHSLVSLGD